MIPSKVMAKLATLGLSEEQAIAVASMLTEVEEATAGQAEAGKEKARARWRRWKEGHSTNVSKRLQTTANVSKQLVRGDARVEDKTSSSEIEPHQEESKKDAPKGDVEGFKAGLAPDVSPDLIAEFIKVRRKKRGALTAFAASLFREDAAKVGMSVAEAAKECVRSSWITVKPEYFAGRPRAGPGQRPNAALAAADALMEKFDAVSPSETQGNPPYPRLVAFSGG
jgi:hypothetical protein